MHRLWLELFHVALKYYKAYFSLKSWKNRKFLNRARKLRGISECSRNLSAARESSPLQVSGAVTRLTVYRAATHCTPALCRPCKEKKDERKDKRGAEREEAKKKHEEEKEV